MGNVVSTRAVSYEEMMDTGRLNAGAGFTLQPLMAAPGRGLVQPRATDPAFEVAEAWNGVHSIMGADSSARVPLEAFMAYNLTKVNPDDPKARDYEAFLNEVCTTAVHLMLPASKTDLGKHCFGYACLLANEFYFEGGPADTLSLTSASKPEDRLAGMRQQMDSDWAAVAKDEKGRVTFPAFEEYFLNKHAGQLEPQCQESYRTFLQSNFRSSLAMMLPDQKDTLGGHCFRYASMMAGEFYFDAANAAAGCGCGAPVADILGVTK
jgi:hypothetical protein